MSSWQYLQVIKVNYLICYNFPFIYVKECCKYLNWQFVVLCPKFFSLSNTPLFCILASNLSSENLPYSTLFAMQMMKLVSDVIW